MTEPTHPEDDTALPDTAAPDDAEPEPEPDDDPAVRKAGKDAAAYRRRLRDTEAERDTVLAERDTLRDRLDGLLRAEVERHATDPSLGVTALARGDDLWLAGTQLDDLLAEDGTVDVEKVKAAVVGVVDTRPHWRQTTPSFDGGARTTPPQQTTFAEVLRRGASRS